MKFLVGVLVILITVLGGYMLSGGHMIVLFQPTEFLVIIGAGVGSFIIANTMAVLKHMPSGLKRCLKGPKYLKENYIELLALLFSIFKMAKSKGNLVLEPHIDKPFESSLFTKFPFFLEQRHAVIFLCDYLRLMTLGSEDAMQMETIIRPSAEAVNSV